MPMIETEVLGPPLKWAGGKRWLVARLRPLFGRFPGVRLVEPFVGGMSIALGLRPARALLSDVNPHLVNFYRTLQSGQWPDLAMQNDEKVYYAFRRRFNELAAAKMYGLESAAIFYYLNRTGFNGLCRFNKKGEFNVPFGKYKTIIYQRDFSAYAPLLKPWEIQCQDFARCAMEREDFLYLDPPYDDGFTTYSGDTFTWEDQVRLADWAKLHPGPTVASNKATTRILDLYKERGFTVEVVEAPRAISCKGDRKPAKEMLALRNL